MVCKVFLQTGRHWMSCRLGDLRAGLLDPAGGPFGLTLSNCVQIVG
jgi:hypothetical protein